MMEIMHPKKMKEIYGTDRPKLYYVCPICKKLTKADEWADDNSCIDCGPIPTESSNV
jgi:hypothetical protein